MMQSLTATTEQSSAESQELQESQAGQVSDPWPGSWQIQLRSLNHRFWELHCQLPEFATVLEAPLRQLLQRRLRRGRVECRLSYQQDQRNRAADQPSGLPPNGSSPNGSSPNGSSPNGSSPNGSSPSGSSPSGLPPNSSSPSGLPSSGLPPSGLPPSGLPPSGLPPSGLLSGARVCGEILQLQQIAQQGKELGLEFRPPSSLEFLQHLRQLDCEQGAIAVGDWTGRAGWQDDLLQFCDLACDRLILARQREGQALQHELLRLHRDFVAQCELAAEWEAQVPEYYRRQLAEKYAQYSQILCPPPQAGGGEERSRGRLLAELSLLLAKGDVREELSRLRIHAERLYVILCPDPADSADAACAKELDFLLQEMNREANTLASKSPIVELQQIAVQLKLLIEQMREQGKNVL